MTTTTTEHEISKPNPYPPELKALNAAIAKAQGEFPPIPKNQKVDTGTYSYEYADLASILSLVRPVLSKHGLALIQRLENPSGGGPSIRTELRHSDGGVVAASFPLGEWQTPQQLGSMVTYIRRYAYSAMLGIAAEEDDDGRLGGASTHGASATPDPFTEESPFQPPDLEEGRHAEEDLSAAQRRKIFAIRTKLMDAGVFTEEQFKAQLVMSFGVDSVSDLSKDDASDLIERLLTREKELDASS